MDISVKKLLNRVMASLSLGLIFFVFSEEFFWGFYRRETPLIDYFETYLIYALFAYIFLLLLYWSKASNIFEIYLVGAIYGWVIEGLFVQTVYENLPYSVSWTALAWHALITILVCFYLIYQSFLEENYKRVIYIFTIIGLIWGILATYWIIELGYLPDIIEFFVFVFICSILLIIGYVYFIKFIPEDFNPSKLELITLAVFIGLVYLVTASATILLVILWTPLILITLFSLKKIRNTNSKPSNELGKLSFYNKMIYLKKINLKILVFAPLLISLFSVTTYSIQLFTEVYLGYIYMISIYIITMPTGFILYFISLIKALLDKKSLQNYVN